MHRSGACAHSPLEMGLQAIQPWPYRTGLAAPRPGRLQTAAASLACSCPRQVSPPGKPGDPGTSPPSSSLLSRGYDEAPHGAHPACPSPGTGLSTVPAPSGVVEDPGAGDRAAAVAVPGDRHGFQVEQLDLACRDRLPPPLRGGEGPADVLPAPAVQRPEPPDHSPPGEVRQVAQGVLAH